MALEAFAKGSFAISAVGSASTELTLAERWSATHSWGGFLAVARIATLTITGALTTNVRAVVSGRTAFTMGVDRVRARVLCVTGRAECGRRGCARYSRCSTRVADFTHATGSTGNFVRSTRDAAIRRERGALDADAPAVIPIGGLIRAAAVGAFEVSAVAPMR
jgi:hypothetical protein